MLDKILDGLNVILIILIVLAFLACVHITHEYVNSKNTEQQVWVLTITKPASN